MINILHNPYNKPTPHYEDEMAVPAIFAHQQTLTELNVVDRQKVLADKLIEDYEAGNFVFEGMDSSDKAYCYPSNSREIETMIGDKIVMHGSAGNHVRIEPIPDSDWAVGYIKGIAAPDVKFRICKALMRSRYGLETFIKVSLIQDGTEPDWKTSLNIYKDDPNFNKLFDIYDELSNSKK